MSNVSSSNSQGVRVPKLRFPGFEGEWELRKAGELFENIVDKNHPQETILTIVQGSGTLPRAESGRAIHFDEQSALTYKMVKKGDFIIHLRSFEGGLEIANEDGIVSPAYIVLRNILPIRSKFYYAYFHTNKFINHVLSKSVEGIRDGKQISYSVFKELKIPYCHIDEQKKIHDLINVLDQRIKKQRQIVELLKSYKRGVLLKLFPQKGETTPQYRFLGFTEPWELRKLGDMADIVGGGTPSTVISDYWNGDIDWYSPAELSDQIYLCSSQKKITEQGYINSSAKMLPEGSVLFTSRAGIGKTAILTRSACTNQGFQSIVPHKGELDSYFIYSRTEEMKAYGETAGAGSTFVEVSGKQMANMKLMIPKSIDEQQTIGDFFQRFDQSIVHHQSKLDELLKVKSALLQQLFI